MNRIEGKLILVTGASSGIGEACARRLARDGANLILWARRLDRLTRLADGLESEHGGRVHVAAVDVRDRAAVNAAAAAIAEAGDAPDVLINNAGLAAGMSKVHEGDPDDWDRMIETNVTGLLNVSRAILPLMVAQDRGHVVNIGSTASHIAYPAGNVYGATKFAVHGLTQGMNIDMVGTNVRVSSVDPGFVETEFSMVRFHGDTEKAKHVYDGFEPLTGADVADAIAYVINAPPHVNVANMLIMPTAQRNVYVVHRKGT
jgi:serine 3-dehydrogenase